MGDVISILGFSGSLRAGSLNTALLRQLSSLAPAGVQIALADYSALPLYNADLGELAAVESLKAQVAAADAVLICSPEYNYSLPGPLKNALDWLSRPAYQSVFAHKPAAQLSVSPGPIGGARMQAHLKSVLLGMVAHVFPYPEVAVGLATQRLQDGQISDPDTRALLTKFLLAFTAFIHAQR